MPPEPSTVYPEREFQRAVVALIEGILQGAHRKFVIVEKFGLDVAVFLRVASGGAVRLFEVKAFHRQRKNAIGFGNERGMGPQVDLLLCGDSDLCLFDSSVRWVFVDANQPEGTNRYALFTCAEAKEAAMGEVERGKQNNLRVSHLGKYLVNWTDLGAQISDFLLAQSSPCAHQAATQT